MFAKKRKTNTQVVDQPCIRFSVSNKTGINNLYAVSNESLKQHNSETLHSFISSSSSSPTIKLFGLPIRVYDLFFHYLKNKQVSESIFIEHSTWLELYGLAMDFGVTELKYICISKLLHNGLLGF